MMTTRPPKAKVIRAHKLADELLAIWPDIREWQGQSHDRNVRGVATAADGDIHRLHRYFRELRRTVEAGEVEG